MKTAKSIAKMLYDDNFPIEKYELLQQERNRRLAFWYSRNLTNLIKKEKELISFGEQVLTELKKLHREDTK